MRAHSLFQCQTAGRRRALGTALLIVLLSLLTVSAASGARRSSYYYCPPGLVRTGTDDSMAASSNCAFWLLPSFPLGGSSQPAENGTVVPGLDVLGVWPQTQGAGVTVALLDTGISPSPDLAPNLLPGFNSYTASGDTADPAGHGTLLASLIAAAAGNGGYVGIAPQAKLLPVRIMGGSADESFTARSAVAGIMWAVAHGARVINCSFGQLDQPIAGMPAALAAAAKANVLVVIAAGNDGRNLDGHGQAEYPDGTGLANTLTVADFSTAGTLAADSNYGARNVQIASLGETLYGDYPGTNDGGFIGGTSAATATVSGVAALLFAADPQASAAQVRQAIISGATPLPALQGKVQAGGLLSAGGALAALNRILAAS